MTTIGVTLNAYPQLSQKVHLLPKLTIVDLRINETRQTGEVRKAKLPFSRLVGAVSNCAYPVRGETAPARRWKRLFIFGIHHSS